MSGARVDDALVHDDPRRRLDTVAEQRARRVETGRDDRLRRGVRAAVALRPAARSRRAVSDGEHDGRQPRRRATSRASTAARREPHQRRPPCEQAAARPTLMNAAWIVDRVRRGDDHVVEPDRHERLEQPARRASCRSRSRPPPGRRGGRQERGRRRRRRTTATSPPSGGKLCSQIGSWTITGTTSQPRPDRRAPRTSAGGRRGSRRGRTRSCPA